MHSPNWKSFFKYISFMLALFYILRVPDIMTHPYTLHSLKLDCLGIGLELAAALIASIFD